MCTERVARGPNPLPSLWRFVLDRYNQRSVAAVGLLLLVGGLVGYRWSDLLDVNGGMDWLLLGIWSLMAALIAWDVSPRRDLLLIAVGVAGGTVIEWWGTNTQVWRYFTGERPPLWILPAWPAAALGIDRLGTLLHHAITRELGPARRSAEKRASKFIYYLLVPGFVLWMTSFVWHTRGELATQVVVGLMVLVATHSPTHRRDLVLLASGSAMGVLLEYWGTSRECWTYYTREVPPPVAVVAHGFAAVAFARVARLADVVLERWVPSALRQLGGPAAYARANGHLGPASRKPEERSRLSSDGSID